MADTHEAWTAALLSPPRTVALGFSHSGVTADTIRYLEIARENGAHTVAITGVPVAAGPDRPRRSSPIARKHAARRRHGQSASPNWPSSIACSSASPAPATTTPSTPSAARAT